MSSYHPGIISSYSDMLLILFNKSLEVTRWDKNYITERLNMLACIRNVIRVVVKKFIMNKLVITVTDYSARVVYL